MFNTPPVLAGYLSPVAVEVHMPVDPKALSRSYTSGEKIPFASVPLLPLIARRNCHSSRCAASPPLSYDDPRYVHHAWEEGRWFGRPEAGKIVYALEGRAVGLADIAPAA